MKKIIAIVGPTASGKTGIGVKLAKELSAFGGGEIVSADSRQVYRGLDIGTGKEGRSCFEKRMSKPKCQMSNQIPNSKSQLQNKSVIPDLIRDPIATKNEVILKHQSRPRPELRSEVQDDPGKLEHLRSCRRFIDDIPQWMIDIVEPGEKFSLFDYLPLARLAIEDIFSRGKVPIVVGGTGLYVQALLEGFELLDYQRPGDRGQRYSREELRNYSVEKLNNLLRESNPQLYQQVDHNNPHRLIRAIEKSQEGLEPTRKQPDFEALQVALDLPRETLYKKIDDRVEQRFNEGMLEEIIFLITSGVEINWLINLGLEYRIIGRFVIGNLDHSPGSPMARNFDVQETISKENTIEKIMSRKEALSPSSPDIIQIANQLKSVPEYDLMKQVLKYRIHAFARRQLTWFRRFPEIKWCQDYSEIETLAKEYLG